ncbi:related to inhibitor of calcineurin [Cephalotrichum gorgonifer]|uniref:Related to inhibitor of calcineurin n=1 Tax=Cephalotrichum gorgonifer TaxID=2041049 RepID=A0AAE8N126_9PEZI|nr:related to inhibitor of calcineurin [Cephalotrichum gorgonifer]
MERPSLLSRRSSSNSPPLSLDLSSLPSPTHQPTAPTNTLLFTNLQDPDIFRPDNLQTIRGLIDATCPSHTWAPLKSFRRIVVSFPDADSAARVRAVWDGESVMGHRTRVYFGQHTPVNPEDNRLALPDAGKLFFISPPPSPPHGWEVRLEDAPNKLVHADDLAEALAKLHHRTEPMAVDSPISPAESTGPGAAPGRSRSSTLIYQPEDHGGDAGLPAIAVEDMTDEPEEYSPRERKLMTHTARPPVELMMHDA